MLTLVILGTISLLLGIIFLKGEAPMKKLEELINKSVVCCKEVSYKYNKPIGAILVILAIVLFYIAWKFAKR